MGDFACSKLATMGDFACANGGLRVQGGSATNRTDWRIWLFFSLEILRES